MPQSIDGVTLGSIVWLTSRIVLAQVRQMVLDRYRGHGHKEERERHSMARYKGGMRGEW